MNSYQNILVGINYTDSSRHALWKANRIALRSGAKVTAYHAVPPAELNEFISFYMVEHTMMMRAAKTSLEHFVEEVLGNDNHVSCQVGEGVPHHELISYAHEGRFDLLILGDDDYANNSRKAGQFAIKCLRFATMPVLLVNRPEEHSAGLILAAIDFSKSTQPVLENAARVSTGPNSKVEIVHACRPPWLRPARLRYQTEVFENQEQRAQYREIMDGQLAGTLETAAPLFPGKVSTVRLEHEDPVTALLEHFDSSQCDLVVIGRSGKGIKGILTDLLGGTAEAIIRHAKCPILIVPIIK
ncbi:universal stress protein [Verrucomicrobiaceae bacterium 227]